MKIKTLSLALITAGCAVAPLAQAATDAERIATLEQQLKAMQAQLEAMKKAPAGANSETQELRNQLDAMAKENVVVGDVPGSFRVPGSDTSVRVYGVAELNAVHESRGDNSGNDYSTFAPYAPINGSTTRKGQTYMHARTSRIGIEGATPSPWGQVSVKVEGDFNNDPRTGNSAVYGSLGNIYTQQVSNSYGFRLRHAYVQMGPLMVGQNWSTFMDIDNTPETVDFNGPVGGTFIRQPQIRYTHITPTIGNFSVALENSVSYVLDPTGVASTAGFARVPDLVARWDKAFQWGALSVRAVTHEHRLNGSVATSSTPVNQSKRGFGLAASGQIKTWGDDFISWLVTGGTGIGRYFNYIEGAGYNASTGSIELERAAGIVLGYQRKFSDTWRMNVVYGLQKNFKNGYTDWAVANGLGSGQYGINKKVQQFHIGAIWNPIKPVDMGLEYIWGQRETLSGQKGDLSRVNLMVRYNIN